MSYINFQVSIFVDKNTFFHGFFFFNIGMYITIVVTTPKPYMMILNQILVLIYLKLPTTSLSGLQRSDIIEELFLSHIHPRLLCDSCCSIFSYVCSVWQILVSSFVLCCIGHCIIRPSVLITRLFYDGRQNRTTLIGKFQITG